ncbi:MAG: type IV pilin protein [Burkholderiales bacterium]|nr:type IV pilin protein [Burkholderiales bacterium]
MAAQRRVVPARGFTLIELMVAVAVVGILAAVAYPSYLGQIAKSRRSDAKQALVELAQRFERFYTERGTYVGPALGVAGIYPSKSPGGYYNLAISSQSADAFTITASPTGGQAGDACGSFGYDSAGNKTVAGGSLGAAQCW